MHHTIGGKQGRYTLHAGKHKGKDERLGNMYNTGNSKQLCNLSLFRSIASDCACIVNIGAPCLLDALRKKVTHRGVRNATITQLRKTWDGMDPMVCHVPVLVTRVGLIFQIGGKRIV